MLNGSKTFKGPLDHYGETGAERFTLLHTVRGQYYGSALPDYTHYGIP